MECAPHRIWKKLMALVLSLVLMAVMLPGALAVDLNVDAGFYFKQSRGGTCTLASAAMMLRRRAFLDGLTDWTDVTENSVRGSAWAGGLSHSFNYNAMQVGYSTLPSNNEAKKAVLIQLLAEHLPPASSAASTLSTTSSLPTTTFAMLARSASASALISVAFMLPSSDLFILL